MRTEYDESFSAIVTKDGDRVRAVLYFDKLWEMGDLRGRQAAEAYIRDKFQVNPGWLRNIEQSVSYGEPRQQEIEYRFSEEKRSFDTITYTYYQTFLNTPVWSGGITVTIKQAPTEGARIVAATNTSESKESIDAELPPAAALAQYQKLFPTGAKSRGRTGQPQGSDDSSLLTDILRNASNLTDAQVKTANPRLIDGRFFIYRYDATERTSHESPALPLLPVHKSIQQGSWYVVAEIVIHVPFGNTQNNWRMLIDVNTNSILYVRGMSSGVAASVFILDPVSRGYGETAKRLDPILNRRRQIVELGNLGPPKAGTQSLEGKFAKIVNLTAPNADPPTRPEGQNFKFDVRSNDFAAVSAYYHVDRFFQLVEDLGFDVKDYFRGTNFPVEVDHRAFRAPWPDGNVVNAALEGLCPGIDRVYFALADFESGFVSNVIPTNRGSGYRDGPCEVKFTGGGGIGATATAHIRNGKLDKVTNIKGGSGYKVPPLIEILAEGGTGAFAIAEIEVKKPIGIAADWRVTVHELGGHGTLWCHLEDDQFRFAHSAGDSFAIILTDYLSAWDGKSHFDDEFPYNPLERPDRFLLFPFEPQIIGRRSDRYVTEYSVARVNVTNPGKGYLSLSLEGDLPGVKEAKAVIEPKDLDAGRVMNVTVTDQGKGYTSAPLVKFSGGGGGRGAVATAQFDPDSQSVTGVELTESGNGYITPPIVNFVGGGPARMGVLNMHIIDGKITKVTVRDPGTGYTDGKYPVTFTGGGGSNAAAVAEFENGKLKNVTVTNGGRGYRQLKVELSLVPADGHAQAQVDPEDIVDGNVTRVTVVDPGTGYRGRAPKVKITGGGGTGAKALAELGTWGWGEGMDQGTDGRIGGGYFSEQILSTTMFRAYRSIGGDAASFERRKFAAHYMVYLMLRAIGQLSKNIRNPETPGAFLRELQAADKGSWTTEEVVGGAYGKVLAWAFEQQNLKDALPSGVDVYIDDGRAGEYDYVPVYWASTAIWNRRSADGEEGHQEPALNQPNFAYVKIANRGPKPAKNVIVKGYHCKPSAGLLWPVDLQAMTTSERAVATLHPNDAEEITVGPFEWTPVAGGFGHDCILMIVSATGDVSNDEHIIGDALIEDWRLVPNDNNIAQRHVVSIPGAGGVQGFLAALHGKGLWVGNPGRTPAKIAASVALPPLLKERNWRIGHDLPEDGVELNPRERRFVTYYVQAGEPFTKANVEAASQRGIVVSVTADDAVIGGMTYLLDPEFAAPFNQNVGSA